MGLLFGSEAMKRVRWTVKTGMMMMGLAIFISILSCNIARANDTDLPVIDPSKVPDNVLITYDKTNPADVVNTKMIIQAPDKTIMNFDSFNISKDYTVDVRLPDATSSFLARDLSGNYSYLNGTLNCNGLFILTNTNGINVGPDAHINTQALILSTRDITNTNFVDGKYIFEKQIDQQRDRLLLNRGEITISKGGFGVLIAGAVENQGVIICPMGTIALAGGDCVRLDISSNKLISLAIDREVADTIYDYNNNPITSQINNTGTLQANGGVIILKAESLPGIFEKAINLEGYVKADRLENVDGKIILEASGKVVVNTDISASESISVKAPDISTLKLDAPKVEVTKTIGDITIRNSQNLDNIVTIEGGYQGDLYGHQ